MHDVPQMTWAAVCARRLARHALAEPLPGARPADIASAICGAHAQVYSAAELSIGLRMNGGARADIQNALWTEHRLIKTFGPRGTVHLLSAEDMHMWIGALSAIPSPRSSHAENIRLTTEQTHAVVEAIAAALDDAELTIDELGEAVIAQTGSWAGDLVIPAFQGLWPRWRQAISCAAHRGVLCFGPNRGRKVTYTNPRRWLTGFAPANARIALADLVKRYLHAYGPATPQHFARWLSAPPRWAADLFDALPDALQCVAVDGRLMWQNVGDTLDSPPVSGVRLLPYFDAYTVGSHPRELVFPGRAYERALAGGQAGNYPVLLIDGMVAGVWHQRRSGRKLAITVEPFGRLTATQRRALDDQIARIGDFLEGDPQLTIGALTTGGHL